jgi:quinol monooxygenase YgiN
MAEVRVIARFAAGKGKEDELRALLQSMLAPTHAESGCKLYELYESDASGRFYFYETWESQAARSTCSNAALQAIGTDCPGIGKRTLRG